MSVFSHVVHNHANQGESNGIYMMVIMYNSFAITVLAEAKCNNCNVDVANLTQLLYLFYSNLKILHTPCCTFGQLLGRRAYFPTFLCHYQIILTLKLPTYFTYSIWITNWDQFDPKNKLFEETIVIAKYYPTHSHIQKIIGWRSFTIPAVIVVVCVCVCVCVPVCSFLYFHYCL